MSKQMENINESVVPEIFPVALRSKLLREGWSIHNRLKSPQLSSKELSAEHKSLISDWLQALSKGNERSFAKRLSWDKLTLEHIAWSFDPPDSSIPDNPSWIKLLEDISKIGIEAHKSGQTAGSMSECKDTRITRLPFWHAFLPIASWAIDCIKTDYLEINHVLTLTESAWRDLEVSILSRLCNITEQALWHLFNSKRSPGQFFAAQVRISSGTDSNSGKVFYNQFIDDILSSGYQAILHEYPVLGRVLSQTLECCTSAIKELLFRISDSRDILEDVFQVSSKSHLVKVECDMGDIHQGGRTVSILHFQDVESSTIRVVYKPKNLDLDANFNTLICLLNETTSLPPLRSGKVISKKDYGFMEWIEHEPCKDREQLSKFYENSGRLLAILHLLGCTDCHHENLIANGDQLILIDCETLFQPDLRILIADNGDDDSPLNSIMHRSVLRTGLLPQWSITGKETRLAYDISALGISLPPDEIEVPGWLNINSDAMIPGKVWEKTDLPSSLPMTRDCSFRLIDFMDSLVRGFQNQAEITRVNKVLIDNALYCFLGASRRLIIRATRVYHSVHLQMLEPAALRSSFGQFIRLEQLARCFLPATKRPLNWPVFHDEVAQMENLDIPFFEHSLDSVTVRLNHPIYSYIDLIERSGLDSCRIRLGALNSDETEFQVQLIYGSINAKYFNSRDGKLSQELIYTAGSENPIKPSQYISESLRIANNVWSISIKTPSGAPEWLSLDLSAVSDCYNFGIIGDSLYSGTTGIGLLFARLSNYFSGSDQVEAKMWMNRAYKCLLHLNRFTKENIKNGFLDLLRNTSLGLSGAGGHLMVLSVMSALGSNIASTARVNLLKSLEIYLGSSVIREADVLVGLAGLIGPLTINESDFSIDLATSCGHIIIQQQDANGGWRSSKKTMARTRAPLTGFSHGSSGIAAALLKLYKVTNIDRFADSAYKALSYERSTFDIEGANWPDLRVREALNTFGRSWCHGAPGILLSRLIIRKLGFGNSLIDDEIQIAKTASIDVLRRFRDSNSSVNSNLCCGLFGVSSILRLESILSLTALNPLIEAAECDLISCARRMNAYPFGDSLFGVIDMPGLLTGNSGVALALLEAADGGGWLPFVLSAGLLQIPS